MIRKTHELKVEGCSKGKGQYVSHACHVCMPCMYVMYVCHVCTCMPSRYARMFYILHCRRQLSILSYPYLNCLPTRTSTHIQQITYIHTYMHTCMHIAHIHTHTHTFMHTYSHKYIMHE